MSISIYISNILNYIHIYSDSKIRSLPKQAKIIIPNFNI